MIPAKYPSSFSFFVLLVVLLLLISCGTTQTKVYTSNEAFWEGTSGLDFSFLDENPPQTLYEGTPFTVSLELENTGAHTLTGFITLSIEDDYMCLVDDNNDCSTFDAIDELSLSVRDDIGDYNAAIEEYTTQLKTADSATAADLKQKIQDARTNIERLRDTTAVANPYKTKWFSLEGKSIFNYEGGSTALTYPAKAKTVGPLSETHDIEVVATACYEYTTTWNQDICIDTDVNKMNIFPGACEATDVSLSGQGAPLAITLIESKMIPTGTGYIRPMFIIHVQNSGNGKVINKEKIEHACTATGLTSKDYNMVFLKSFILSSEDLMYDFNGYDPKTGKELNPGEDGDLITCTPNPLILKGDDDKITCIVNEDAVEEREMFSVDQAPYMTQLSMQFDYGYTLSQSTQVTIEKILTY